MRETTFTGQCDFCGMQALSPEFLGQLRAPDLRVVNDEDYDICLGCFHAAVLALRERHPITTIEFSSEDKS